jgi:1-deoxy-D-xylulose-5-phosphate reductoisomerase
LSAANEVAVGAFLDHRIGFGHIAETIKETLAKHEPVPKPGLSDILSADTWARRTAEEVL